MSFAKVLIKFIGPHPADNVISAAALEPEILILTGYGSFLTDTMRSRYNYFFHHRRMQTIVSDPLSLERYLMGDIENRLEKLLARYEARRPVVDIADADAIETMALGTVLRTHKYWNVAVLSYSLRDGVFLPLKNGEELQQLSFPSITAPEYAYLRDGTPMNRQEAGRGVLYRRDLNRHVIKEIRALNVLYAESPSYWRDTAARFRYAIKDASEDRTDYLIDAVSLGIRDTAFEELRDVGILKQTATQNGIVRAVFADKYARDLFMRIEKVPLMNIFLSVALIRAYGQSAAYHDLAMYNYSYITCIRGALPVVIMIYNEQEEEEQIYRFHVQALKLFDEPVRKVLVRFGQTGLSDDVKEAASRFGVEIIPMRSLTEKMEPR